MKKIFIIAMLCIPYFASAQLAVEGGFSFNKVKDITAGNSPKGKHFGLIYSLNIKRAGLRTGLRYMDGDLLLNLTRDQIYQGSTTLRSKFIEIPVELKYRNQRFKHIQPYVTAGAVGRLPVDDDSQTNHFENINLAGTAAFGIEIKGKEFGIMPEIGYAFPLTKVTNGTYTANGITFQTDENSAFNGFILRVSVGWIR